MHSRRQQSAYDRTNHWHPAITPIALSFGGDWQKRMSQPRGEITSRINRVACGPAQRQANGKDQQPNRQRPQGAQTDRRFVDCARKPRDSNRGFFHQENRQDQQECSDHLAEKGLRDVPDVRRRAKASQFARRVFRGLKVLSVKKEDERGTRKRPQHLRHYVACHLRPWEFPGRRHGDGYRRVDVRTTVPLGTEHCDEDCQPPAGGDNDPTGVVSLGSREHHVGHHAVAENYQQGSANELGQHRTHKTFISCSFHALTTSVHIKRIRRSAWRSLPSRAHVSAPRPTGSGDRRPHRRAVLVQISDPPARLLRLPHGLSRNPPPTPQGKPPQGRSFPRLWAGPLARPKCPLEIASADCWPMRRRQPAVRPQRYPNPLASPQAHRPPEKRSPPAPPALYGRPWCRVSDPLSCRARIGPSAGLPTRQTPAQGTPRRCPGRCPPAPRPPRRI